LEILWRRYRSFTRTQMILAEQRNEHFTLTFNHDKDTLIAR